MKLVETDADRPEDEGEPAPAVTPPRPEKRRAYASLVLTLAVLVGTVVTIYMVFPARQNEATRQAVAAHRRAEQPWQLEAPSRAELEAWTLALVGRDAPLPREGADLTIVGARAIEVLRHQAAFIRFRIGGAHEVSYLVQRTRDAPADRTSRGDGDDQIEAWRDGGWTVIAIGPGAGADAWRPRVGVP
jgi:hypothetical protein